MQNPFDTSNSESSLLNEFFLMPTIQAFKFLMRCGSLIWTPSLRAVLAKIGIFGRIKQINSCCSV